jgi:hypothetical protein
LKSLSTAATLALASRAVPAAAWPEKRESDGRPTLRLGLACVGHGEFVKVAVLLQLYRDRGRAHWQLTLDTNADVWLEHPSCAPNRHFGRTPLRVLMIEEGASTDPELGASTTRFVLRAPLSMQAFFELLSGLEAALLGPVPARKRV